MLVSENQEFGIGLGVDKQVMDDEREPGLNPEQGILLKIPPTLRFK